LSSINCRAGSNSLGISPSKIASRIAFLIIPTSFPGVKLKVQNLKVKKNKATNSIIINYDCPATTKDAIIHNENAYFAQPNADGTHPIYYDDNDKILTGKRIDEELVRGARIEKEDTLIKTKKVRASKKRKGSGTRRRR
jgi:hypothetical protein